MVLPIISDSDRVPASYFNEVKLRLESAEADVDAVEARVDAAETRLDAAEASITDHESRITTLEEESDAQGLVSVAVTGGSYQKVNDGHFIISAASTDSGAVFNAALDALPSDGGRLDFEPGNHTIATTPLLDRDRVTVVGYGALLVKSAGIVGFKVQGTTTSENRVMGLKVKGTGATDTSKGFEIHNVCILIDVFARDCNYGIHLWQETQSSQGQGDNLNTLQMIAGRCEANNLDGLLVSNESGFLPDINNMKIDVRSQSNGRHGIHVDVSCFGNTFTGISEGNTNWGVKTGTTFRQAIFDGFYTEANGDGGLLLDSTTSNCIVVGGVYVDGITDETNYANLVIRGSATEVILGGEVLAYGEVNSTSWFAQVQASPARELRHYSSGGGGLEKWSWVSAGAGTMMELDAANGVLVHRPMRAGVTEGTTAQRPASPFQREMYFDTTIGKPIWWTGAVWVDATGAAV